MFNPIGFREQIKDCNDVGDLEKFATEFVNYEKLPNWVGSRRVAIWDREMSQLGIDNTIKMKYSALNKAEDKDFSEWFKKVKKNAPEIQKKQDDEAIDQYSAGKDVDKARSYLFHRLNNASEQDMKALLGKLKDKIDTKDDEERQKGLEKIGDDLGLSSIRNAFEESGDPELKKLLEEFMHKEEPEEV